MLQLLVTGHRCYSVHIEVQSWSPHSIPADTPLPGHITEYGTQIDSCFSLRVVVSFCLLLSNTDFSIFWSRARIPDYNITLSTYPAHSSC